MSSLSDHFALNTTLRNFSFFNFAPQEHYITLLIIGKHSISLVLTIISATGPRYDLQNSQKNAYIRGYLGGPRFFVPCIRVTVCMCVWCVGWMRAKIFVGYVYKLFPKKYNQIRSLSVFLFLVFFFFSFSTDFSLLHQK